MIKIVLFLVFSFSYQVEAKSFLRSLWPFGKKSTIIVQQSHQVKQQETPIQKKDDNTDSIFIIMLMFTFGGRTLSYIFGRDDKESTAHILVEPYFMPSDRKACLKQLYRDLQNAQEYICVASYWLTHLNIIMALRQAAKRKVIIEVIFDVSTPNAATLQQLFANSRIHFVQSDIDAARMHHKFIIIDGAITWAGSANLTGAAFSKNYENLVRIESRDIAQRYSAHFRNLKKEFGQKKVYKNYNSKSIAYMQQQDMPHPFVSDNNTSKPISDYQVKILTDFGIDSHELNYDQAYTKIDKVIHSAWRLIRKNEN